MLVKRCLKFLKNINYFELKILFYLYILKDFFNYKVLNVSKNIMYI